jgi:osmotically-inducible protein OsmY
MSARFLLALPLILLLPGCTPVGAAAGAGATVGIAAAQEGGVKGAVTDLRIKAMISDKWFQYDLKTFTKLSLTVDQGRVLITGVVQNPDSRLEAVRLAWQVEGVTQVINEIKVADSRGIAGVAQDEWITARLRAALTFNRDIDSINYSIDTVQGTVYLMGVAQNQAELDRVIGVARTIPGVEQVVSYVKMAGEPIPGPAPAQPAQTQITTQVVTPAGTQTQTQITTQPDMSQPDAWVGVPAQQPQPQQRGPAVAPPPVSQQMLPP